MTAANSSENLPANARLGRWVPDVPAAASIGGGIFGEPLEREPSMGELFAILRKRRLLILNFTLAALAIALLWCLWTPNLYKASSSIEIRGYAPVLANTATENLYGSDTRKADYQKTTVAKLKLAGVADEVLNRNGLAQEVSKYFDEDLSLRGRLSAMFSGHDEETDDPDNAIPHEPSDLHYFYNPKMLQAYLNLIDINPITETNLVEIEVTTRHPELSQKIANEHASGFIDHLRKERQEVVMNNLKLLQAQADDLKTKFTQTEQKLSQYADDHKIVALSGGDDDNKFVTAQITNLTGMVAEATTKRVKSESLLKELQNADIDSTTALDDDPIRDLRVKLKETEAEAALLGQKVTAQYPAMQELGAKISSIKKTITDERKRRLKELQAQYQSDVQSEKKLLDQIEKETAKANQVSKSLVQYNLLYKESQSLRDLYQAVLRQMQEMQVSIATGGTNVFVAEYATLPTSANWPKTKLILIVALVVGAAIGAGIAILLDFLDSTIEGYEDAQRALGLPFLGAVPDFNSCPDVPISPQKRAAEFVQNIKLLVSKLPLPGRNGSPEDITTAAASNVSDAKPSVPAATESPVPANQEDFGEIITITSPQAIVSEALRTLRAAILLSSADNPPKVIMVTSATKGDGKTTVVSNLAVTLAQASHRTLLIDADLRQSRIGGFFGVKNDKKGLADYLAGQAGVDEVIFSTSVPHLDVLPAGSQPPNPAELIGSKTMTQMVEALKAKYDFILIDSPPVLPVADSLMLSRTVDSVLLVIRSKTTERPLAQEARRRLLAVNARILGVVLNGVDLTVKDSTDAAFHGSYAYPSPSVDSKAVNG